MSRFLLIVLSCASQDSDAGIEIRTFQNGKIISEPSFCVESPFGFTFQSSGHLIVADPWSHCVRLFDYKDGRQTGRFKCKDEMDGSKKFKPLSVAVDAAGDIVVYCYLSKESCVRVYSQHGHSRFKFIRLVGSMILSAGGAIAFDSDNNLVVSDDEGGRIRVVSYPDGNVIRTILIQSRPDTPRQRYINCGGFVFDGSGHIFVANIADRCVNICDYSTGSLLRRICFRKAPGSHDDPGCLSVAMNDKDKMLIVSCSRDVYYYPMHLIMGADTGLFVPPTIVQEGGHPVSSAETGGEVQQSDASIIEISEDEDGRNVPTLPV
jgi:WD40 repeat protein